jgi:Ser/Thr protein kinase RdoA (MazF antagonist)
VEIARRTFALEAEAVRFATEKDDTFRLDLADGRRCVLKIAHPSEPRDELDLQVAVLRHLERRAAHLPVPRTLPDRQGVHVPVVETRSGERRAARLMTFLPGQPLDATTSLPAQRECIGELLAQLRLALADFSHPADGRIVAWDVQNVLDLSGLIGFVAEPEQRRAVQRALDLFAEIEPRLRRCRRQVLHNDFNTSNLVVSHDNPRFVNGIIDFGDAVRTAVAIDVSTALMNQMPKRKDGSGRSDLFDEARDVLRGYLRHADLTDEERELVPFLAFARQATRALLTSWRASLFPENAPYILRNTQDGWFHLAWLHSLSKQQIADLLAPGKL